jgi:hypothetical protein
MQRPQTAATTTKVDEARIKKKIDMLDQLERKIELDLEDFNAKRKDAYDDKKYEEMGERVTKEDILEAS